MSYIKAQFGDKYSSYPHQLASYLISRFGIAGKILDLACGRGEYSEIFLENGMEVEKIDKDPVAAELNDKVLIADIDKGLPYSDNEFDWIFAKHIIEHVNDAEHLLKESYRVLKPGGKLLVMTQDWFFTYRIFFSNYEHKRPFTKDALKLVYTAYNFKDIHIENFYQLPFTWRYPYLRILPCLLRKFAPYSTNKLIKYSKKIQLLGIGEK